MDMIDCGKRMTVDDFSSVDADKSALVGGTINRAVRVAADNPTVVPTGQYAGASMQ